MLMSDIIPQKRYKKSINAGHIVLCIGLGSVYFVNAYYREFRRRLFYESVNILMLTFLVWLRFAKCQDLG